jgi:hypothetical protein
MLKPPSALVTRTDTAYGPQKTRHDRPDPLKVNGNILALDRGKGY